MVGYLPLGLELVWKYLAEDEDLPLADMLQYLKEERLQDPSTLQVPGTLRRCRTPVSASLRNV